MALNPTLGKWLYGALFAVLLPAALIAWAWGAEANVGLPAVHSVALGSGLAAAGVLLWLAGVASLARLGGGLPMNAFPPPRLVTRGAYAITGHPIYVGFTLAVVGVAIAVGSAAGLWLVAPALTLGCVALWWGYERIDLERRLGLPPRSAWLGVPQASGDVPSIGLRAGAVISALAVPAVASVALRDGFERRAWAALILVSLGSLAARSSGELRELVVTSWLGTLLTTLVILATGLPVAPFTALAAMSGASVLLGRLPRPWALAAALALGAIAAWALSTSTAVAAACFLAAVARRALWSIAVRASTWCANCWRESDLGRVRIIHIGWFAAVPAGLSSGYAVILLGPSSAWLVLVGLATIIIGSALWAQTVEGSAALSRPFGFFGGVAGVAVFAAGAPAFTGGSPWALLGAFAAIAPLGQGLARLRCLANGCCHGAPCAPERGIVYRHPRTRVVRLAGLGGVPIYPTQLYSLLGNAVLGVLLWRLWAAGVPLAVLSGVYFVLMGLARFAEEAWRGEPQTPVHAGLRLYQWIALASVIAGAALTCVHDAPRAPAPALSLNALWVGLAAAGVTWLVASVDFPRSNRRFSRLA